MWPNIRESLRQKCRDTSTPPQSQEGDENEENNDTESNNEQDAY